MFAMFIKKLSDYYEVQIVHTGLRSSIYFTKNQPSHKTRMNKNNKKWVSKKEGD